MTMMSFSLSHVFRWLFLAWICLFCPTLVQGQEPCAQVEAETWMSQTYPDWPSRDQFEQKLSRAMATHSTRADTIFSIPLIVHVVHDGSPIGFGYNLSEDQILSQIEVLNEDYRRLAGTPGFNSNPVGADIQIEFCLATVDPNGFPLEETGIHRIDRNEKGWIQPPYSVGYVKQSMMPQEFWDPDQYMNVWSIPLSNDFLGFAQLPNFSGLPDLNPNHGPAATDGVVITPTAFGRIGTVNEPYNQGRTMTHEVGHWLGLWHIWGDGDCEFDDYCEDTPEAADPHYDCPETRTESCGSQNFFENYMDYTDDVCMNLFTNCQRSRMRTVMQAADRRAALFNSEVCQAKVAPAAAFATNRRFVCEGSTVRFRSISRNQPNEWAWEFPGGEPTSSTQENPAISYESTGTYAVRLIVGNQYGKDTLLESAFIQVDSVGSQVIFFEGFEQGLGDWEVKNQDDLITWKLEQVAGTDSGQIAVGINFYDYTSAGAKDNLITPLLDLSGYEGAILSFQHAYRQGTLADRDSLVIYASEDGGQTYPHRLLGLAEDGSRNFATNVSVNESYLPERSQDWCFRENGWAPCIRVNLTPLVGSDQFSLQFQAVNDFGNNLYLDNISLEGSCVPIWDEPQEPEEVPFLFTLFPNPGSGEDEFFLRLFVEEPSEVAVEIFDSSGRQVFVQEAQPIGGPEEISLDLRELSHGIYFVRIQVGESFRSTKLFIY